MSNVCCHVWETAEIDLDTTSVIALDSLHCKQELVISLKTATPSLADCFAGKYITQHMAGRGLEAAELVSLSIVRCDG
jgi:hypothetical protein